MHWACHAWVKGLATPEVLALRDVLAGERRRRLDPDPEGEREKEIEEEGSG